MFENGTLVLQYLGGTRLMIFVFGVCKRGGEMLLIVCYSLRTCFNRCFGHRQGSLQDYRESKQTVNIYNWTTNC